MVKINLDATGLMGKICSVIGAIIGVITAFMLGGEIWGWLWLFLFTPAGAIVGRICGWLFSTKSISQDINGQNW